MIKLSQDLSHVIERAGAVVVPTRQRAEAVRLAYAAAALGAGRRVWRTPDVLPLDAWLAREIQRLAASDPQLPRLLSPAEDWLLWRDATLQLTGDLELIARAPLAEALRRADSLALEFEIEPQAASGSEHALLVATRRAVCERHRALGATTAARHGVSLPALGDGRTVLFCGFGRLTPQLNTLIAARRARGWETLVEKGREHNVRGDDAAEVRIVIAGDMENELERIADWTRQFLMRRPDARLLVMLPGAAAARERLARLVRQSLDARGAVLGSSEFSNGPVAIEGGDPLDRSPLVAHALASLRWLTARGELAELSEWLRAPYWRAPDLAMRSRLDLALRERLPLEPKIHELLAALAALAGPLAPAATELSTALKTALHDLRDSRASPREWSKRLHAALDALGWQGAQSLSSDEHQTAERFLDLLRELGGLDCATGPVTREVALQWLHELAANASFRPASGDALVTVSPSLAHPVVCYDGIWVAGLHAESWPQPVSPDPFLPLAAQITAGVPAASAAGRIEQARLLMASWAALANELVLSAPSRDGDMELLPSPLLAGLPAPWPPRSLPPGPDGGRGASETNLLLDPRSRGDDGGPALWLPLRLHREGLVESFSDPVGAAWPAEQPLPAGTRSLELQNECPFRAYAELRLSCEPLYAREPGIAADERGRLLHLALESFWRQVKNSEGLLALSVEAAEALIGACLSAAAEILWRLPPGTQRTPAQAREIRRASRLIHALFELERDREPFTVSQTEFESTLAIANAQLRVRIDRLDTLADGGVAILDYKSGRPRRADWYGERPSHLQLLAYLATVGERARAMATVNVTAREVRFDGIAAQANLLPKVKVVKGPESDDRTGAAGDAWTLRYQEWCARLAGVAREFLTGHAVVDPRPGACDYCHVATLCRIADLGASPEEEAVDD